MRYPIYRPRRIREQAPLRRMVRGQLSVDHFIYPLFVVPGDGVRHEIQSMPGNFHLSIDRLLGEVKEARSRHSADHFVWLTERKDAVGSSGYADDGIIPRAVNALKSRAGHDRHHRCLPLRIHQSWALRHGRGGVCAQRCQLGSCWPKPRWHMRAGADMVGSDMMDGRVQAIRQGLDNRLQPYPDYVLCRQICLKLLWSIPGSR